MWDFVSRSLGDALPLLRQASLTRRFFGIITLPWAIVVDRVALRSPFVSVHRVLLSRLFAAAFALHCLVVWTPPPIRSALWGHWPFFGRGPRGGGGGLSSGLQTSSDGRFAQAVLIELDFDMGVVSMLLSLVQIGRASIALTVIVVTNVAVTLVRYPGTVLVLIFLCCRR